MTANRDGKVWGQGYVTANQDSKVWGQGYVSVDRVLTLRQGMLVGTGVCDSRL